MSTEIKAAWLTVKDVVVLKIVLPPIGSDTTDLQHEPPSTSKIKKHAKIRFSVQFFCH